MELTVGYYPQMFAMVLARVAAVMMGLNYLGGSSLPVQVKVMMCFMLALAMLYVLPPNWVAVVSAITTMPAMVVALLNELLIGMAIGAICGMFTSACIIAGAIIGFSNSLSMAQSIDPVSGGSSVITGQCLKMVFIMIVFLMDGHLVLVQLLAKSFETVPLGSFVWDSNWAFHITAMGSLMYDWGMKLAIPVLTAALIIDACMGLISKLAPDFDILFLSLPIRLFVGIAAFGLMLRYGGNIFDTMVRDMFSRMGSLLAVNS